MSANMILDIGGSCQTFLSLPSPAIAGKTGIAITSGGCVSSLSGVLIGDIVDMRDSDAYCNVFVAGKSLGSGPLVIGIQCADAATSGSFTDPTSGLPQLPRGISSGGFIIIGSGNPTETNLGVFSSGTSGQIVQSGFMAVAAFQRPAQRYARLYVGSGFMDVAGLAAGFISHFKQTGSGGGFTYQPSSGSINV